jgi:hypothetical protein
LQVSSLLDGRDVHVAEFSAISQYSSMQTSKTDNNALDIDVIYHLNLEKHNLIQQTKLSAKFPWPPIMPKQHEWILQ